MTTTNNKIEAIRKSIENMKGRSAWDRGVNSYALELLDSLEERIAYEGQEPENVNILRKWLLNGADDWSQASWGGCFDIYDMDIAKRLCSPSELKKTDNGRKDPNKNEQWLDVQARALFQAARKIEELYR